MREDEEQKQFDLATDVVAQYFAKGGEDVPMPDKAIALIRAASIVISVGTEGDSRVMALAAMISEMSEIFQDCVMWEDRKELH
tara:strand:- start:358 stop:606 length:249 start_codon:yes stop_codon:yes gene_type:complete